MTSDPLKQRTGRTDAGSPRGEKSSLVNKSGLARTAEAHQHPDTEQCQHDAAWFGNGVDLVSIKAASRVAATGLLVRIQPEGGDVVPGKVRSRSAAERQRG